VCIPETPRGLDERFDRDLWRKLSTPKHPDQRPHRNPCADAFLVSAETDSGVRVFLIASGDNGISVTPLNTTGLGNHKVGSLAHREGDRPDPSTDQGLASLRGTVVWFGCTRTGQIIARAM
jgi:hypothetical protein